MNFNIEYMNFIMFYFLSLLEDNLVPLKINKPSFSFPAITKQGINLSSPIIIISIINPKITKNNLLSHSNPNLRITKNHKKLIIHYRLEVGFT